MRGVAVCRKVLISTTTMHATSPACMNYLYTSIVQVPYSKHLTMIACVIHAETEDFELMQLDDDILVLFYEGSFNADRIITDTLKVKIVDKLVKIGISEVKANNNVIVGDTLGQLADKIVAYLEATA